MNEPLFWWALAFALFCLWCLFLAPGVRLSREILEAEREFLGNEAGQAPVFRGPGHRLDRLREHFKQREAREQEVRSRLDATLRAMDEAVLIVDRELVILLANEAASDFCEPGRSIIGRPLLEVFRNHLLRDVVRSSIATRKVASAEIIHERRLPGGYEERVLDATALPVLKNGEPDGAVLVARDLTELRHLESVRRDFVANVSHELRTPLSIISGYLETLLEGAIADEPTARGFLATMSKHTTRLNLIVEDLLTLSRLENEHRLEKRSVVLPDLLKNVLAQIDLKVRASGAVVNVVFPPDFPPIEGDSLRLEQVFLNLIDNAIKYCGAAQPRINVVGTHSPQVVTVSVEDNGPGIPLADQPHVFERFYRVHKSRSRDVGGTGLGLAIVKHIIQSHGGTVRLKSRLGSGSQFTVNLPPRPASLGSFQNGALS